MCDFLIAAFIYTWIFTGIIDYNLIIDNVIMEEPEIEIVGKLIIFILSIIGGPISLKNHINNTKKGK